MPHFSRFAASFLLAALLSVPAAAPAAEGGDYTGGVKSKLVLRTTTTSSGDPIRYPAGGTPEVTALIVDFPPGAETGWHLHAVPVYSWVVSGSVTVEMEGGKSKTFQEGEAIVEMVGLKHLGRNTGTVPARLLVFYTGLEGKPIVQTEP